MIGYLQHKKISYLFKSVAWIVLVAFTSTLIIPPQRAHAQLVPNLPAPGTMVSLTPVFKPTIMKGIKVFPDNPLRFDFIIDSGDSYLEGEDLKEESMKLIKYFLASLTVPEEDMWVNLSPYEGERVVPQKFGVTEMGKDLLAQDYILKQLTASLIYPEDELGSEFWDRIYQKAARLYGTTDVPVNTFNKVWIVPDEAEVFVNGEYAFVLNSHLKVMLDSDYHALMENLDNQKYGLDQVENADALDGNNQFSDIVREVIIPEIEREVNQAKNFAPLRQIYNSFILATWYKKNLRETLLGRIYMDKNKVSGVDVEDKALKEKIYQQYLEAFQKGVYNYIKEDYDPVSQELIPRKYFSGGMEFTGFAQMGFDLPIVYDHEQDPERARDIQLGTVHRVSSNIVLGAGDETAWTLDPQGVVYDVLAEGLGVELLDVTLAQPKSSAWLTTGAKAMTFALAFSTAATIYANTGLTADYYLDDQGALVLQLDDTQLGEDVLELRRTMKSLGIENDFTRAPLWGDQGAVAMIEPNYERPFDNREEFVVDQAFSVSDQLKAELTDTTLGDLQEQRNEAVIADLTDTITALRAELAETRAAFSEDLDATTAELDKARAALTEQTERVTVLYSQVTTLQVDLEQARANFDQQVAEMQTASIGTDIEIELVPGGALKNYTINGMAPEASVVFQTVEEPFGQQTLLRLQELERSFQLANLRADNAQLAQQIAADKAARAELESRLTALEAEQLNAQQSSPIMTSFANSLSFLNMPNFSNYVSMFGAALIVLLVGISTVLFPQSSMFFVNNSPIQEVKRKRVNFSGLTNLLGKVSKFGLGLLQMLQRGVTRMPHYMWFSFGSKDESQGSGAEIYRLPGAESARSLAVDDQGEQAVPAVEQAFGYKLPRLGGLRAIPAGLGLEGITRMLQQRTDQDDDGLSAVPNAPKPLKLPRLGEGWQYAGAGGYGNFVASNSLTSALPTMEFVVYFSTVAISMATLGVDSLVTQLAMVATPILTRLFLALQLWLHEIIGHLVPASLLRPVSNLIYKHNFGKVFTAENLKGGLSLSQWMDLLTPGKNDFDFDAGVTIDQMNEGVIDQTIRLSGFGVSLAILFGVPALIASLIQSALVLPLILPFFFSGIYVLAGSWKSDVQEQGVCGRYGCANSGVLYFATPMGMNPAWVRAGELAQTIFARTRGTLSLGRVTPIKDRWGRVLAVPFVKAVKPKRFLNIFSLVNSKFNRSIIWNKLRYPQLWRDKKLRFVLHQHHNRLPTGSPASKRASHPHGGLDLELEKGFDGQPNNLILQGAKLTHIVAGKVISIVTDIHNYITHNGQMKSFTLQFFGGNEVHSDTLMLKGSESHLSLEEFFLPILAMQGRTLPTGDSPRINLALWFLMTQGDWRMSVLNSWVTMTNTNAREALKDANMLTLNDMNALASLFEEEFSKHASQYEHLMQSEYADVHPDDLRLNHLWVTDDMVEREGKFRFLQESINSLKDDILNKARLHPLIQNRGLDEAVIKQFVDRAIQQFLTADREYATLQFKEFGGGAFGLSVGTSKEEGVTLFARDQELNIGFKFGDRPEDTFVTYGSGADPLKVQWGNKGYVDYIWDMKIAGKGEVVNIRPLFHQEPFIEITAHKENGTIITDPAEFQQRMAPFDPSNEFHAPLKEYRNPKTMVDEDLESTPSSANRLIQAWNEMKAGNGRMHTPMGEWIEKSFGKFFHGFVSRTIEQAIKTKSQFYGAMRGYIENQIYEKLGPFLLSLSDVNAGDVNQIEGLEELREDLVRAFFADTKLYDYIKLQIDELIWQRSDELAETFIANDEPKNNRLIKVAQEFDQALIERIESLLEEVFVAFQQGKLDELKGVWDEAVSSAGIEGQAVGEEGQSQPEQTGFLAALNRVIELVKAWLSGNQAKEFSYRQESPKAPQSAVIHLAGTGPAKWISHAMVDMMRLAWPKLPIGLSTSNQVVEDPRQLGVYSRTMMMFMTTMGADFPTLAATNLLKDKIDLMQHMVPKIDAPTTTALNQELFPGADFKGLVFPFNDHLNPAEASTEDEILLYLNQIQLVLHTMERFRQVFPKDNPWAEESSYQYSEQDIDDLYQLRDQVVGEAERIVGFKADNVKAKSEVNEQIVKRGNYLKHYLRETPMVNFINRAYVYLVVVFHASVTTGLLNFVDYLTFKIQNWLNVPIATDISAWANLKTVLTIEWGVIILAPFIIMLAYRKFVSGRPLWERTGAPQMVIGDMYSVHAANRLFVKVLGALSFGAMASNIHSGDAQDELLAEEGKGGYRGKLYFFGRPADATSADDVERTALIMNSPVTSLWGFFTNWLTAGPQTTTIGRGEYDNDNATDHYIDIGEQVGLKNMSPFVQSFNKHSFDALGRFMTYKVLFFEMYKRATRFTIGKWTMLRLWDIAESYNTERIGTTEGPKSPDTTLIPTNTAVNDNEQQEERTLEVMSGSGGNDVDKHFVQALIYLQKVQDLEQQAGTANERNSLVVQAQAEVLRAIELLRSVDFDETVEGTSYVPSADSIDAEDNARQVLGFLINRQAIPDDARDLVKYFYDMGINSLPLKILLGYQSTVEQWEEQGMENYLLDDQVAPEVIALLEEKRPAQLQGGNDEGVGVLGAGDAPGGIRLEPRLMNLKTRGETQQIEMLPDIPMNIESMDPNHVTPVIFQIVPIPNAYQLLGLNENDMPKEYQEFTS